MLPQGRYTRGSLLPQHAPGAKLPRLHQRFLAKKYVAQQNFCSRVLLPHIKLVWYEERVSEASSLVCTGWGTYPGACFESVFKEQAPTCVLVGVLTYPGACFGSVFQEQALSCVLAFISNLFYMREQAPGANLLHESVSGVSSLVCTEVCFEGACFRGKLLRVFWLEYLPGRVFRERVSGASSLVCTGWSIYPGGCFGSVFQEQAPSCVLVGVFTREGVSGACFRSKLLRVYWLEYLPGRVFRERVSGASSLVCTGLKDIEKKNNNNKNKLDKRIKTTNPSKIDAICAQDMWKFNFMLDFSITRKGISHTKCIKRVFLSNQQSDVEFARPVDK